MSGEQAVAGLALRCPSCGASLGEVPSFPGSVRCTCGFRLVPDGDCWDACADASYPRTFARQWALWEKGKLGDPSLVYGKDPVFYFRELLAHTSLTPADLAPKRILEVGCGHGRLLRQIQEICPTAYGLDLAKPPASARLRPGSVFFGSLLEPPFEPGQFDLLVCRGVIHHTPDPPASFECLADQVAEGGMLYLAGFYDPGTRGILAARNVLPWSWKYPDWLLLGLTRVLSGLRTALEAIRLRRADPAWMATYYRDSKLEIFDVLTPRWSRRTGEETVKPWFSARGFDVRKVDEGSYVGVKRVPGEALEPLVAPAREPVPERSAPARRRTALGWDGVRSLTALGAGAAMSLGALLTWEPGVEAASDLAGVDIWWKMLLPGTAEIGGVVTPYAKTLLDAESLFTSAGFVVIALGVAAAIGGVLRWRWTTPVAALVALLLLAQFSFHQVVTGDVREGLLLVIAGGIAGLVAAFVRSPERGTAA